jgi:hypothetical protein
LDCNALVVFSEIFAGVKEEMSVFSQTVVLGFVFFCFRIASSYCSTLMLNPALPWNTYSCMSSGDLRLVQV